MNRICTLIIISVMLVAAVGTAFAQGGSPTPGVVLGDHTGYTLFTPQRSNQVYLVDGQGRIAHDWTVSGNGGDAILRENGNLVVAVTRQDTEIQAYAAGIVFAQSAGRIEEYTWDGDLVWAYEPDIPGYVVHHGIEVLPNGNVMFIVWEYKTSEEAIAAGRDPALLGHGLWPDAYLEYSPEQDAIVWEWHTWDHLIQDFDPNQANYGVVADNPQLVDVNYSVPQERVEDWMHSNAIDYNPQLDQVLFSVREFNEFWIVDHSITTEEAQGEGGDLLYRWGNPEAYDRGGFENRRISYQHDVKWVPEGNPGAGNIILFSNRHSSNPDATLEEIASDADHSMIIEMTPPLLPDGSYALEDGQPYAPAEPTWTYDGLPDNQFFSNFISGVERLANGDTFITRGSGARLFEVDPGGQLVWDYLPPFNQIAFVLPGAAEGARQISIFRARRYEADYPAFADRDLSDAAFPADMATTDVRYPGLVIPGTEYGATLSGEFPVRYYATYIRPQEVAPNTFAVEVLDGNIDPVVTVANLGLEPFAEDDNSGGERNALIDEFIPADVGWTIIVVSHAGDDMTGVEGRFRLVRQYDDRFADIALDIPRILYGAKIQDSITEEDPESLFVFFGEEGEQITIRMQRDNASLNPVVELLDTDQEVLVSASPETELPVALIDGYILPESGLYYVHTTRERASDTVGVYTMELTLDEEAN